MQLVINLKSAFNRNTLGGILPGRNYYPRKLGVLFGLVVAAFVYVSAPVRADDYVQVEGSLQMETDTEVWRGHHWAGIRGPFPCVVTYSRNNNDFGGYANLNNFFEGYHTFSAGFIQSGKDIYIYNNLPKLNDPTQRHVTSYIGDSTKFLHDLSFPLAVPYLGRHPELLSNFEVLMQQWAIFYPLLAVHREKLNFAVEKETDGAGADKYQVWAENPAVPAVKWRICVLDIQKNNEQIPIKVSISLYRLKEAIPMVNSSVDLTVTFKAEKITPVASLPLTAIHPLDAEASVYVTDRRPEVNSAGPVGYELNARDDVLFKADAPQVRQAQEINTRAAETGKHASGAFFAITLLIAISIVAYRAKTTTKTK